MCHTTFPRSNDKWCKSRKLSFAFSGQHSKNPSIRICSCCFPEWALVRSGDCECAKMQTQALLHRGLLRVLAELDLEMKVTHVECAADWTSTKEHIPGVLIQCVSLEDDVISVQLWMCRGRRASLTPVLWQSCPGAPLRGVQHLPEQRWSRC